MERLTKRTAAGIAYLVNVKQDEQVIEGSRNTLQCIFDSWQKLAEYEDAEESGKLEREVAYMPELTIKEVIQILKHNYEDEMRYHDPNKRYAEAMRIGYTELEKQIPTKAIYEVDSFTDKSLCPKCRHDMDGYEFPYCPACGQKIDWR